MITADSRKQYTVVLYEMLVLISSVTFLLDAKYINKHICVQSPKYISNEPSKGKYVNYVLKFHLYIFFFQIFSRKHFYGTQTVYVQSVFIQGDSKEIF